MITPTYPWPVPRGHTSAPIWTGHGFRIDEQEVPLLSYAVEASGWTDELTAFHEDGGGAGHFMNRASRRYALGEVRRQAAQPAPVILEIGCLSGVFLQELRSALPRAQLIGADYVRRPLESLAARMPDIPLVQFDLIHCPLRENSIDILVLLNVLEHIQDDAAVLHQVYHILKPGGAAIIEVPAGPHLFDVYDKFFMHFRRYDRAGFRALLDGVGFSVARLRGLGALLYPGFWYVKRKNKRYLSAPDDVQAQVVAGAIGKSGGSRLLDGIMWLESFLRHWMPFPCGIRWVATCIKPPHPTLSPSAGERAG